MFKEPPAVPRAEPPCEPGCCVTRQFPAGLRAGCCGCPLPAQPQVPVSSSQTPRTTPSCPASQPARAASSHLICHCPLWTDGFGAPSHLRQSGGSFQCSTQRTIPGDSSNLGPTHGCGPSEHPPRERGLLAVGLPGGLPGGLETTSSQLVSTRGPWPKQELQAIVSLKWRRIPNRESEEMHARPWDRCQGMGTRDNSLPHRTARLATCPAGAGAGRGLYTSPATGVGSQRVPGEPTKGGRQKRNQPSPRGAHGAPRCWGCAPCWLPLTWIFSLTAILTDACTALDQ